MGFIKDVIGGFFGSGADAAKRAASEQEAGLQKEKQIIREAGVVAVAGVQPFAEAGTSTIGDLTALVTDPQRQLEFIQDNPFFKSLADEATRTLLQNQAAKGKIGSGGTAEALQESLVLLGADLLNQNITQRQNLAQLGFAGAQQAGEFGLRAAGAVGGVLADIGETRAAGVLGKRAAESKAAEQAVNIATLVVCDIRMKENIVEIGNLRNGLPIYFFNYIGDDTPQINVMAQDVEKVLPEAVIEINGIKHVDIEKVASWSV